MTTAAQNRESEMTSIAKDRLAYYRELVALAETQRQLLVGGKHDELADSLKRQDPILLEIGRLDKREEALGGMPEDATPEHRQILRLTAQAAADLAKLTRINSALLENAREFVAFSIGILTKTVNESAQSGLTESNGALLLDRKV